MAEILFFDDQAEYYDKPAVSEELAATEEAVAADGEIIEARKTTEPEAPELNSTQKRRRMQNAIERAQNSMSWRAAPLPTETKTAAQKNAEFVEAKTRAAIEVRLGPKIDSLVINLQVSGRLDVEDTDLRKFPINKTPKTAKFLDLLNEEGYLLAEDNKGEQAHYLDPTGWIVAKLLVDSSIPKYDKDLLLGGNRTAAKSYIALQLQAVMRGRNA
jgi:hypothetical protein